MKVVNNGLTIEFDGIMGHFPKEFVVSALEKQIPKKVMLYNNYQYHCECGEIVKSYYKYCPVCGQALDWGEKE